MILLRNCATATVSKVAVYTKVAASLCAAADRRRWRDQYVSYVGISLIADILGALHGDCAGTVLREAVETDLYELGGKDISKARRRTGSSAAGALFTGTIIDKLGQKQYYENGVHVKGPFQDQSSGRLGHGIQARHHAPFGAGGAQPLTPVQQHQAVNFHLANEGVKAALSGARLSQQPAHLVGQLLQMTVPQLYALKQEHHLQAPPAVKQTLAPLLVDHIKNEQLTQLLPVGSPERKQLAREKAVAAEPAPQAIPVAKELKGRSTQVASGPETQVDVVQHRPEKMPVQAKATATRLMPEPSGHKTQIVARAPEPEPAKTVATQLAPQSSKTQHKLHTAGSTQLSQTAGRESKNFIEHHAAVGFVSNPVVPKDSQPKLTNDQMWSAYRYTLSDADGGVYEGLNQYLRGKRQKLSDSEMAALSDLQNAFADIRDFDEPVTVYRLMPLAGNAERKLLKQMRQAAKSGGVVEMLGYTSTSTSTSWMNDPDVVDHLSGGGDHSLVRMVINAKRGFDMNPYSEYPSENELVLDHKSTFLVDRVVKSRDGNYIVYLDQQVADR